MGRACEAIRSFLFFCIGMSLYYSTANSWVAVTRFLDYQNTQLTLVSGDAALATLMQLQDWAQLGYSRSVSTVRSVCLADWSNYLQDLQTRAAAWSTWNDQEIRDEKQHKARLRSNVFPYHGYQPAPAEAYIIDHAVELGYDMKPTSGCALWRDKSMAPGIYDTLHAYRADLRQYQERVQSFNGTVRDLRVHINDDDAGHGHDICQTVQLHPDGLTGIFNSSGQLSMTSAGLVEPLFPPLRHPEFCLQRPAKKNSEYIRFRNRFGQIISRPRKNFPPNNSAKYKLNLQYLVHDFEFMCHQLKRTSRNVLIDMGASLQFHGEGKEQPAMFLVHLFHKFGFRFDHIYAYEITQTPPNQVFQTLPADIQAAYHWINVGVSADPNSDLNPLKMLLQNYNRDDFIVIKLDIDTSGLEMELANQLLNDDRYADLVDAFYFEQHVYLSEMSTDWGTTMAGSLQQSLELFSNLRKKGIPAHSWV